MSKEPYKYVPHNFVTHKKIPKPFCQICGLVNVRNPITEWAIKKGCNNADHPQYKQVLKKLTKQFTLR